MVNSASTTATGRPPFWLRMKPACLTPRPFQHAYQDENIYNKISTDEEFRYFELLPAEIRHQIWDLALPPPRILDLCAHARYSQDSDRTHCSTDLRNHPLEAIQSISFSCREVSAKDLPNLDLNLPLERNEAAVPAGPAILYVNRESRDVAMKHYKLAFAGWHKPDMPDSFLIDWERCEFGKPKIWVDFDRDVFAILHNAHQFHPDLYHLDTDAQKIKIIAMRHFEGWLSNFKSLQKVYLLFQVYHSGWASETLTRAKEIARKNSARFEKGMPDISDIGIGSCLCFACRQRKLSIELYRPENEIWA